MSAGAPPAARVGSRPGGAVVRFGAFLAVAAASLVGVQAVVYPLLATVIQMAGGRLAAVTWTYAAALVVAHVVCVHWLDRGEGWQRLGLDRRALAPHRIAAGLAVGTLAIALPTALLLGVGWLRGESAAPGSWAAAAVGIGAAYLPAALWEELLFRGYGFRALADGFGVWPALAATSVLFGLVHLSNAGANAQSTALVTLAGFFLGAVLLRTGSLYAAWAAHWGWNVTLAAVFHIAVSGTPVPTPDYRVVDAGPDWATGGPWGPEGGAAAGAGMLGALWLLLGRRPSGAGRTTTTTTTARAPHEARGAIDA